MTIVLDPVTFRDMARDLKRRGARQPSLRFSRINWILLVTGLASITLGYILVANASTVLAPLLLVLGYVVLIPLAIIL